ncbi:MAG: SMI1/KNR4 family protein [Ruminococcaceae bacterium]|nr:SMI1/KNR4 family protein [Oscillospiraceae bacterium]
MKLTDFIVQNNVDMTPVRIDADNISGLESLLGIKFGTQLRKYILDYGYLGYEYCELYGVNGIQMEKSDMIVTTLRLHSRFPATKGLVVLENYGDGDYYMVDGDDNVYRYICETDELSKTELKLFDYIVERFEFVKSTV